MATTIMFEDEDGVFRAVSADNPLPATGSGGGVPGEKGEDGREVELRKGETHIQWRYEGDGSWQDLVALADLKGEKGDPGDPTLVADGAIPQAKVNGLVAALADRPTFDEVDQAIAALDSVGTVEGDVLRIYSATTTPSDGVQAGDLVVSPAPVAQGPAAIPGLFGWYDASVTGAKDLGVNIPDVSGNDNHIVWRNLTDQVPAAVGRLNGLPAFQFAGASRYSRPGTRTGPRTFSGVVRFDAITPLDQPLFYTGGDVPIALGIRGMDGGSSGRFYVTFDDGALYNQPVAWDAAGSAYVSFILAISSTAATLWLDGQVVANSSVPGGGTYATLAISAGANAFFNGALGEFAEHEGTTVDSVQASELAEYYKQKWRV